MCRARSPGRAGRGTGPGRWAAARPARALRRPARCAARPLRPIVAPGPSPAAGCAVRCRRSLVLRAWPLLAQAPSGQSQEDVFEGGAADQRGLGREGVVVELLEHLLGVVGIEHQRLLVLIVALDAAVQRADQSPGVAALIEPELQHLPPDVLADQVRWLAIGDDPALVHDHEAIAEALGLLHV